MITDEDKERVRQATDLVALVAETVELRQRGQEFWGCCPFHGEKNPSFKVNPNTGLWHCFGCGEGGDVFSYVQKRENLEFPDAIRYLADRAGIELAEERGGQRGPRRNRLIECLTEAESFYSTMLMRSRSEGAAQARAYFAGRGFGSDVCRRWGLGYAPGHGALVAHLRQKGFSAREIVAADLAVDRSGRPSDRFYERVMFPIHDELGRTIAFGGRIMGKKKDVAKYVNTRDTAVFNKGKHLFAYDRAKQTMAATGQAIVCEGYTDVIAMHEAGFTNAVAALGTAFRLDHVKLMERQRVHRITCMFDGDAAGQRAAERAVRYIDKTTAEFRCVVLPDDMDPMEFLAARGADELRPILEAAEPLMDFVFAKRLEGLDLSVPGRRVAALKDMALLLAPLKHSVLLDDYATRLADTLGLKVEDTKRAIREAPVQDADDERPRRGGGPQGAAGGSGISTIGSKFDPPHLEQNFASELMSTSPQNRQKWRTAAGSSGVSGFWSWTGAVASGSSAGSSGSLTISMTGLEGAGASSAAGSRSVIAAAIGFEAIAFQRTPNPNSAAHASAPNPPVIIGIVCTSAKAFPNAPIPSFPSSSVPNVPARKTASDGRNADTANVLNAVPRCRLPRT